MKTVPDEYIMRLFDAEGNYIGPTSRNIVWLGEIINIDEYAATAGLTLPDSGD